MTGFDPTYRDIGDYLVRATHRIWEQGDMGHIYDIYTHNCTVHTSYGLSYGAEEVLSSSVAVLAGLPDQRLLNEDVIWTGDPEAGFHTSHLSVSTATNTGYSPWGPPTGRAVRYVTIANCFVKDNRISEAWLARDTGGLVRQLGFDLREVARNLAQSAPQSYGVSGETDRLRGQGPPPPFAPRHRAWHIEDFAARAFHDLFNRRQFSAVAQHYAPDAVLHVPNHSQVRGLGNIRAYFLGLVAMFPDAHLGLEHLFWLEGDRGYRAAVRWRFSGTHGRYGWYGAPTQRQVQVLGISHLRVRDEKILEHHLVFDELALLAQLLAVE